MNHIKKSLNLPKNLPTLEISPFKRQQSTPSQTTKSAHEAHSKHKAQTERQSSFEQKKGQKWKNSSH
jgi:hypothetical protein